MRYEESVLQPKVRRGGDGDLSGIGFELVQGRISVSTGHTF